MGLGGVLSLDIQAFFLEVKGVWMVGSGVTHHVSLVKWMTTWMSQKVISKWLENGL